MVLLSFKKCGVILNNSSSLTILSSSLFNKIFVISSFLSVWINGEFESVFWDKFKSFLEGSISSFEFSGIIILRLFCFCGELSIFSSLVFSFMHIFEGINIILFVGIISFGCSFWEDLASTLFLLRSLSRGDSSKKSLGKIILLATFIFDKLYIFNWDD